MKKMTMDVADSMTFEKAFEKYLDNCRVRNLREGSIYSRYLNLSSPKNITCFAYASQVPPPLLYPVWTR